MKSIVILVALIVCLARCDEELTLQERLRDIFSEKCNANANSIFASLELLIASNRLEECIPTLAFQVTNDPIETLKEFCKIVKLRGYRRVKTFVKRLIPCLEEEEQFLGDFITSGFNATFDHICGEDDALNVNELVESFVNGSCSSNTTLLGDTLNRDCLVNLKFAETLKADKFVLKQQDVCSDVNSIKSCLDSTLQVHCGSSYSKILTTIFEPYISWCTENEP